MLTTPWPVEVRNLILRFLWEREEHSDEPGQRQRRVLSPVDRSARRALAQRFGVDERMVRRVVRELKNEMTRRRPTACE